MRYLIGQMVRGILNDQSIRTKVVMNENCQKGVFVESSFVPLEQISNLKAVGWNLSEELDNKVEILSSKMDWQKIAKDSNKDNLVDMFVSACASDADNNKEEYEKAAREEAEAQIMAQGVNDGTSTVDNELEKYMKQKESVIKGAEESMRLMLEKEESSPNTQASALKESDMTVAPVVTPVAPVAENPVMLNPAIDPNAIPMDAPQVPAEGITPEFDDGDEYMSDEDLNAAIASAEVDEDLGEFEHLETNSVVEADPAQDGVGQEVDQDEINAEIADMATTGAGVDPTETTTDESDGSAMSDELNEAPVENTNEEIKDAIANQLQVSDDEAAQIADKVVDAANAVKDEIADKIDDAVFNGVLAALDTNDNNVPAVVNPYFDEYVDESDESDAIDQEIEDAIDGFDGEDDEDLYESVCAKFGFTTEQAAKMIEFANGSLAEAVIVLSDVLHKIKG